MPVQKQTSAIPLRGLDTNADPRNAVPGSCDLIENLWAKRRAQGGFEFRKRFGVTQRTRNIFGGGTLSVGKKLQAYNDEELLFTGTDAYTYQQQLGNWKTPITTNCGKRSLTTIRSQLTGVESARSMDIAVGGGYICVIESAGNGTVLVMELATGQVVGQFTNGTSGFGRRVLAMTSKFIILTWDPGGGVNCRARTIDYATPTTISGSTTLFTDVANPNSRLDAIRDATNDTVIIGYNATGGLLKIQVVTNTLGLSVSSTDAEVPNQCVGWFASDPTAGTFYLGYVGSVVGAKVATVLSNATISAKTVMDSSVTTARNVTGYRLSGTNVGFIEVLGSPRHNTKILRWPGSGTTAASWQLSMGIGGKAFLVGTTAAYIWAAYEASPQSFLALLDATASTARPPVIARYAYGNGTGLSADQSCIPATVSTASSKYMTPFPRLGNAVGVLSSGTNALVNTGSLTTVDFAPTDIGGARVCGEGLVLPAANPQLYDTRDFAAAGFMHYPEAPTLAAGAGAMTGDFKVKTVLRMTDARGDVAVSSPSPPASITLAAQGVTVTQPSYRVPTQGNFGIYVDTYLTKAGEDAYYLVASTINSPLADTTSVGTLDKTDTQIGAGQEIYTAGGVLGHSPFPPCRFVETWRGRPFFAGTDAPGGCDLWVGIERKAGEAAAVSDQLVIPIEADGGPITGLSEDDDRVLIFKETSIYALSGVGPADNSDGQFEQPARIFTGIGATDPRPIIKTPVGVMFKGLQGLYLLPRGAIVPVRQKKIEAYDSLTITGAVLMEDLEQVRFVTAEGTTLVYHYTLLDEEGQGTWTTFTGQAAVDCAIFGGKFCYLATDGTVQVENTAYNDNSASITAKLRTCFQNLAGLFGRLKLYRAHIMGEIMASFTLSSTVTVRAYGADTTDPETKAVTTASIEPFTWETSTGRAEQVQMTVEETSTTEGFRVSALGFEVGLKGGSSKRVAGQVLT